MENNNKEIVEILRGISKSIDELNTKLKSVEGYLKPINNSVSNIESEVSDIDSKI